MDHPVRIICALAAAFLSEAVAVAQEPKPMATPSEGAAVTKRVRTVSPQIAVLLATALPKIEAPKVGGKKSERSEIAEPEKPANGIVRLPRYLVREPKLPTPLEIMTRKELENYAMKRYIGPEDGIDRGFLNLFTIAGLWKKIPVLGSFPFVGSETNEDRGIRLHEEAERKRKMEEMAGLMKLTRESGDTVGAARIKQESDKTFIRPADFGR